MTAGLHYRVNLRVVGRQGVVVSEREVHKDLPRLDTGMQRALRAHRGKASVLIVMCFKDNDECSLYHPPGVSGGKPGGS